MGQDWVQVQAEKHQRLIKLQESVQSALEINGGYSETAVRVGLMLIRRYHGEQAEQETRDLYGIKIAPVA
jgi:hypothetical protein